MASYTSNLNLLKKDPVADAADTFNIQTMLNENWDKIDAALAAARSAEEYDPAGTYAVDDYCVHGGQLYKCTEAITAGEAWDAAHWTETSVGAELEAMLAALNGKAITLTLTATISTGWTSSGGYYYKQVSVPGMLATDNPVADILPGSDNAANKLYAEAWGKVQSIDTLDGAVKLWCTAAPTTAFPVQFKVVRG
jgi:hypothetical protein